MRAEMTQDELTAWHRQVSERRATIKNTHDGVPCPPDCGEGCQRCNIGCAMATVLLGEIAKLMLAPPSQSIH